MRIKPRHIGIGVLVLLLVSAAAAAIALTMDGRGSARCGRCHPMSPYVESWKTSSHSSVKCYDCHAPRAADVVRLKSVELFSMYTSSRDASVGAAPALLPVPGFACSSCHASSLKGVVSARGLRFRHDSCGTGTPCLDCHAGVGHAKAEGWVKPLEMEQCTRCHVAQGATLKCDSCHSGKRESALLVSNRWKVTHGPDWRKTHGLGDISSCVLCHQPSKCAKCHGIGLPHSATFDQSHGVTARTKGTASCFGCHDKKHYCDVCHGMDMPHPKGFLKRHSKIAKNIDDPACTKCHQKLSCTPCHIAHVHPGGPNMFPKDGSGK